MEGSWGDHDRLINVPDGVDKERRGKKGGKVKQKEDEWDI